MSEAVDMMMENWGETVLYPGVIDDGSQARSEAYRDGVVTAYNSLKSLVDIEQVDGPDSYTEIDRTRAHLRWLNEEGRDEIPAHDFVGLVSLPRLRRWVGSQEWIKAERQKLPAGSTVYGPEAVDEFDRLADLNVGRNTYQGPGAYHSFRHGAATAMLAIDRVYAVPSREVPGQLVGLTAGEVQAYHEDADRERLDKPDIAVTRVTKEEGTTLPSWDGNVLLPADLETELAYVVKTGLPEKVAAHHVKFIGGAVLYLPDDGLYVPAQRDPTSPLF